MSLLLIAPILFIYEIGILMLGPVAMRNGADAWLRQLLERAGFGQYFLLPLLTCGVLLGAHHLGRHQWQVCTATVGRMFREAILFAIILLGLSWFVSQVAVTCGLESAQATFAPSKGARLVSYLGAGVYEELFFRLMLIPAIALILRQLGEAERVSWITATIAASVLFAAAHYQCFVGCGDVLTYPTFVFRFTAGMVFSSLFILRGFGVAVCAHAIYDVALYFVSF